MTDWLKCMGTRVGMEHVQEQPHVQLFTSDTHINIPTCSVFIIQYFQYFVYSLTASGILCITTTFTQNIT